MTYLTSDWWLPGSRPDTFRSTQDKVDWILAKLQEPDTTPAWGAGSALPNLAKPSVPFRQSGLMARSPYVGEGEDAPVAPVQPPQIGASPPQPPYRNYFDPFPQPRNSWETTENILSRLQRRPDPAIDDADAVELFHLASSRRGGSPSALTPRQQLDLLNYNQIRRHLERLNPSHAYLSSERPRNWFPSDRDLFELRDAVEREMRSRGQAEGFPRLERHHHLPREHWPRLPTDVDPESTEYIAWLLRELHRLKPDGLHTGENNWNKIWGEYLTEDYRRKKIQIDRRLDRMIRDFLRNITGKDTEPTEE